MRSSCDHTARRTLRRTWAWLRERTRPLRACAGPCFCLGRGGSQAVPAAGESDEEAPLRGYEDRPFGGNCKLVRGACLFMENGRQRHAEGRWMASDLFACPWGERDTWIGRFSQDGVWTTTVAMPFSGDPERLRAADFAARPRCFEPFRGAAELANKAICPSVHCWWEFPLGLEASGLAVEVEATATSAATFFMAAGFHCGYMGIQDREPRWVIFSVWNGDEATQAIGAPGPGVTVRPFGGEGEGLQSFRPLAWSPGRRYRCVVTAQGVASSPRATDFTGWLQDVQVEDWTCLATFRRRGREETGALRGAYSFLEDWAGTGVRRSGRWGPAFANQDGVWRQVRRVRGTSTDAAAWNVRVRPLGSAGLATLGVGSAAAGRSAAEPGGRVEMLSGGPALEGAEWEASAAAGTDGPGTFAGPHGLTVADLPATLARWPLGATARRAPLASAASSATGRPLVGDMDPRAARDRWLREFHERTASGVAASQMK